MASTLASQVVIFPFMAQGHTLPLLDLSKALSLQQIKVSIITTPSNANSITKNIANYPFINVIEIPFPTIDGLPQGCENTSQLPSMELYGPFLHATKQLQEPFDHVLQTMLESETPPLCVISDFFLGWTLASCQALGIPRLVFHGMGVLSLVIGRSAWVHAPQLRSTSMFEPLDMPDLKLPFTLTRADLPGDLIYSTNQDDPASQFSREVMEADAQSWGVIVNSFEELEKTHVPSLESFYMDGAKAWCLGPLFLHDKSEGLEKSTAQKDSSTLTQWLNEQVKPDSVIYVSFGTQADVSDAQLDEVAFGLEESGSPFIWVARSKTWSLPGGMEEKIKGRGLIVKEWVDQRQILSHRAIGGFLSHCGWNSVLESLSSDVPILAWPMIAEQFLNAKFIMGVLGAALGVRGSNEVFFCPVERSRSPLSETFRDFSWYKNKSRPVQMSPTCWATGVGSASDESFLKGSENGSLLGAFDESASAPFVTLEAEITPETIDFFVSDADGDPDCPTEGYSSIEQALHTLRIVSVGMKEEDLERLKLPLMSPETENEDSSAPMFTITVDAKSGTCTGVSASDRAKIVLALSSLETKPEDFRRPGHVFPLKYRNGGVLRRAGHTEASVDLVMMAGLPPVSVLSAIIDPEDGSIARKIDYFYSIFY
ncbi:hypothetical protein NC653_017938 [Populus alba x Populus x berolinensis]|uniref:anthocyanidin 3-O-glucosyltransferase n=1 Tax=Populus alba x Populus x berolinensis TaxID=444605 RepID=A0AAD6QRQ6_9ROSI|nr:hypothetical protein NC653_017938 [Populus alba x Populus x berolinensis]